MRLTASLARPPSPTLPMWKRLGEQRVEHRRGVGCDFLVAADEADAVALADLLARARHRRFEKPQSVATRAPSAAMRSGSQVEVHEHDLAGRRRQQRVLDHVLDLIGVEHRDHDRIAVARDIGKRSGARAEICQARAFRRIDVEADDGKSRRDQAARIDLAHQADADDADGCA